MKLVKTIIDKKLENSRKLKLTFQEVLAYQERISAYLIALAYLRKKDEFIRKKKNLWKRFANTGNRLYFLKLLKYKPQEEHIILQAMKKMDIVEESNQEYSSDLFTEFSWAILSYEHEESD